MPQALPATMVAPQMRAVATKKKSLCCSQNWQSWPWILATLVNFSPTTDYQQLLLIEKNISGTAIALLTVIILSVKFSINTYVIDGKEFEWYQLNSYIEFIITGVTVLVVAVPEGLPLAVTLSLAYSVKVRFDILIFYMDFNLCLSVENDEGQQLGEASWCLRNHG